MPSLKGTETEQNLKNAFASEIQGTAAFSISPERPRSRATTTSSPCSARLPRARLAMLTGISNISRKWATRRPARRSVTGDNLKAAIASETTNTPTCFRAWPAPRQEGFDEIADWFETLAKTGKSHTGRFQKALDAL
jgi:hypothetical protein